MSDGYIQVRLFGGAIRCEFERTLNGEQCTDNAEVKLDGLRLCRRHSAQLHLEERVTYWRAMLAHVELWAGEAGSRGRDDVGRLLEIERARASNALERAYVSLQRSRDGRGWDGEDGQVSRDGEVDAHGSADRKAPPLRPPLLLLSISVSG